LDHRIERLTATPEVFSDYLSEARQLVAMAASISEDVDDLLDDDAEQLRWFPLPHEVAV
jgi:hypothetical protein